MLVKVLIADYICGPYTYKIDKEISIENFDSMAALDLDINNTKNTQEIQIGSIVLVPLRSRKVLGMIVAFDVKFVGTVKNIIKIYPHVVNKEYRQFMTFCARYNCLSYGDVLRMILYQPAFLSKTRAKTISQEFDFNINLNTEQETIQNQIVQYINKFKVIVLEGVPGSGKTEIFLSVIWQILLKKKQVLILVPEIALTSPLIARIRKYFGCEPIYWHSNVSISKKKVYLTK